jgi:hypothetical protein
MQVSPSSNGQTKGVGGSRTQIIFNNKSVATIEHRHGRDKAGELYKVSVSLLQRGLGIAGFAPVVGKMSYRVAML